MFDNEKRRSTSAIAKCFKNPAILIVLVLIMVAGNVNQTSMQPSQGHCVRADTSVAMTVHFDAEPSMQAGRWERATSKRDWLTTNYSTAHLACLREEHQGVCSDDNNDKISSRHSFMARPHSTIINGNDTLQGQSDWGWRVNSLHPNHIIRELYDTITLSHLDLRSLVDKFVHRQGGRFFIIGDSLKGWIDATFLSSI
jgi:hypothetical protein